MLDHQSLLGLYPGHTAPPHRVTFSPSHSRGIGPGTGSNTSRDTGAAARLVETLALASVGKSTQKLYLAKWNT